jgi:hypothetical protein
MNEDKLNLPFAFAKTIGECFACKGVVFEDEGYTFNHTASGTVVTSHTRGKCYPRTITLTG